MPERVILKKTRKAGAFLFGKIIGTGLVFDHRRSNSERYLLGYSLSPPDSAIDQAKTIPLSSRARTETDRKYQ